MTELRRVGLNLLFLVPGETGGSEIYARNLIPALVEERPELELVAFVNREATELELAGVEVIPVGVSGRGRIRREPRLFMRPPELKWMVFCAIGLTASLSCSI